MAKTLVVPSNFNIDHALDGLVIGKGSKDNYWDAAYYLVSLLVIQNSNAYKFNDEGFRPLSSKMLEGIVGKKVYSVVKNHLLQKKVIEMTTSYQAKKSCKKFKLHPHYQTGDVKNIEVKKWLALKVDDAYKAKNEALEELAIKYEYLKVQFEKHALSLDGAEAGIVSIVKDRINSIELSGGTIDYDRLHNKLGSCEKAMENLTTGKINFSPSSKNHRIHSAFTALPKCARSYLKIDGLSVVELDLKCSQPYFLLCILTNREFFTSEDKGFNCETIYPELKKKISGGLPVPGYVSEFWTNPQAQTELENFKKALSEDLYAYMREKGERYHSRLFGLNSSLKDRNKIKNKFMMTLFDGNYTHRRSNPVTVLFSSLFPCINTFIYKIMKDFGDDCLPYLLQRTEAFLVLETASKHIYDENPTAPIFTIHDAIVTTAINGTRIQEQLINSIFGITGIMPVVVQKYPEVSNVDRFFETESNKKDIHRFTFPAAIERGRMLLSGS